MKSPACLPKQVSMTRFQRVDEGEKPLPSHHKPFLKLVQSKTELKALHRIINIHHSYVPQTIFCGRSINWLIKDTSSSRIMGAIGVASAVLAMADRDKYIGWKKDTRLGNLTQIANNNRYCLMEHPPANFGSQVLRLLAQLAPIEWKKKYGDPLYLLETLVKPPHTGAVYKGAGWKLVGKTKGAEYKWVPKKEALQLSEEGWQVTKKSCQYGDRIDRERWKIVREDSIRKKLIFVKPLHPKWRLRLLTVRRN